MTEFAVLGVPPKWATPAAELHWERNVWREGSILIGIDTAQEAEVCCPSILAVKC